MKDLLALGASLLGVLLFMGLGAIALGAINLLLSTLRLPILFLTPTDYLLAGVIACLVYRGAKEGELSKRCSGEVESRKIWRKII
jgi:hypothetical protein